MEEDICPSIPSGERPREFPRFALREAWKLAARTNLTKSLLSKMKMAEFPPHPTPYRFGPQQSVCGIL